VFSITVSSTSNTAANGRLPHGTYLGASRLAPSASTTESAGRAFTTVAAWATSAVQAWRDKAAASPDP
jgi:hypothetical protein